MQRKRGRDLISESVNFGNSIIPVRQMRKFTMKKLLKYFICIIIGFVVYSIYQKHNLASQASDNRNDEYDPNLWESNNKREYNIRKDNDNFDKPDIPDPDDNPAHKRVKEEIKKVFDDLKRKHEDKEKAANDIKQENDFNDVDDQEILIADEKEDNNIDDDNADAIFEEDDVNNEVDDAVQADNVVNVGEDANNGVEADKDDFEPIDEAVEKEQLELEQEIEERLADAFKDAVNKVADENPEAIEEIKNAEKANAKAGLDTVVGKIDVPEVQQVIEKKEFNAAVMLMGKKLHPLEIHRMNEQEKRRKLKHDDDHEFPPFVTAVRQTTVKQTIQLIASIQQHLSGRKIYVYDLDLDKEQKKQLMSYCGVRVRLFMKQLFPSYVSNLDNMHWKPLIMQTALAEFGHITWVNPGFRLGTQELAPLVHESHETGILVIGQSASYTTFSATHPDMLKFIPSDKEKLSKHPHIEIRAVMIHNTPEVHENIMKVFTACAMEDTCLAPKGAKWQCRFDFTGRKHADCHRYDESALNILLKNWFDFDMAKYARRNNYFRSYDSTYRPHLKTCRDAKDIRDSEL